MRVFIITIGSYSDYGIVGVAKTQKDAVQIAEKINNNWESPNIELWENDQKLIIWEYQKGGFVEGMLKIIWYGIDENKFKLYKCCKHCDPALGFCPDKHWYNCETCKLNGNKK